jgi:hypothetical protein
LRARECFTKVCHKSVEQECQARVPHESVPQECSARVCHKSVTKECPTRLPEKSVKQEYSARVAFHAIEHLLFAFHCSLGTLLLRELLTNAFGFVASIRLIPFFLWRLPPRRGPGTTGSQRSMLSPGSIRLP